MDECIFCKIAAKKVPAKILGESEYSIAFPDISPSADTHILIVPKLHIKTFLDFDASNKKILSDLFSLAQNLINSQEISRAYKLIFNGGKYQEIDHLHWHLLGGNMKDKK